MTATTCTFSNKDLKEKKNPYTCFSTYFVREFMVQGQYYPTVEHYLQSQKFTTPEYKEEIRKAKSGVRAKALGTAERDDIVPNWEEIQKEVMKRGLKAKFSQHPDLKAILMSTNDNEIIFKSSTDEYWGSGKNDDGKNVLGELLMDIRDEYRLDSIKVAMQAPSNLF